MIIGTTYLQIAPLAKISPFVREERLSLHRVSTRFENRPVVGVEEQAPIDTAQTLCIGG